MNKITTLLFLVLFISILTACTTGKAGETDFFCSDSDDTAELSDPKDSYYVKGYTDSNFGAGEDVCIEGKLVEYYCDGDVRKRISYDCSTACVEGVCVK